MKYAANYYVDTIIKAKFETLIQGFASVLSLRLVRPCQGPGGLETRRRNWQWRTAALMSLWSHPDDQEGGEAPRLDTGCAISVFHLRTKQGSKREGRDRWTNSWGSPQVGISTCVTDYRLPCNVQYCMRTSGRKKNVGHCGDPRVQCLRAWNAGALSLPVISDTVVVIDVSPAIGNKVVYDVSMHLVLLLTTGNMD